MKKIDPMILVVASIAILVGVGIFSTFFSFEGEDATQYQSSTSERPKIVIAEKEFDFGDIALQDIKTKEVEVRNDGQKPLILSNFSTSCNCTFVQLIQGDKESPRFSMHYTDKWQAEIVPNEKALVRVIYQPSLMPVQGKVNRSAVFKTNDPDNPSVVINFTANVQ
ncbi:DUF1573 domain-containing protein [Candidatus Microgenomates bacterium]|nr:DUF1573 domain-containing protein [Candidatus Microgenomates bacterium]